MVRDQPCWQTHSSAVWQWLRMTVAASDQKPAIANANTTNVRYAKTGLASGDF